MAADRERVLPGSIEVGDYITTSKPTDVWWKVLSEASHDVRSIGMIVRMRKLRLINKAGYQKDIVLVPGTGRRYYRWLATEKRLKD